MDLEATAQRTRTRPAAQATTSPIVGSWALLTKTDTGEFERLLTVKPDMSAVYQADGTDYVVSDFKFEKDQLTFKVPARAGLVLSYTAAITKDKLAGKMTSSSISGEVIGQKITALGMVGIWDMVMEGPQGDSTAVLTFTSNEGKVSATWNNELGDIPITTMKIEGNSITLSAKVVENNLEVNASFSGRVGIDKLTGVVSLQSAGAQDMDEVFSTTGVRRKVAASLTREDLVGDWALTALMPDGTTSQVNLNVDVSDGKFTASLITEMGSTSIDSITIEGNNVSFATEVNLDDIIIPVSFFGSIIEEVLSGEVTFDLMGEIMSVEVSGTKIKK